VQVMSMTLFLFIIRTLGAHVLQREMFMRTSCDIISCINHTSLKGE
jgi:hypothetical protein